MNCVKLMAVVALSFLLIGCANTPIGSGDYGIRDARTTGDVEYGVVEHIRPVRVHEQARTGSRGALGATVGAIGGAALGSQIGNGSGRRMAQAAGAGVGASVGSRVDQRMAQQSGYEIQAKLQSGRRVVVTQGSDQGFQVGQPIRLIRHGGTYRVTR